jgi:hypothetical protein
MRNRQVKIGAVLALEGSKLPCALQAGSQPAADQKISSASADRLKILRPPSPKRPNATAGIRAG